MNPSLAMKFPTEISAAVMAAPMSAMIRLGFFDVGDHVADRVAHAVSSGGAFGTSKA